MKVLIIDAYTFYHVGAGVLLRNNLKIIRQAFNNPEIQISAFLAKDIEYHTNLPVVNWLDFFYLPSDISNKLVRKLFKITLRIDWKLWKILIKTYYNLSNRFDLSFNPLLITFSPGRRRVVKAYMDADIVISIIGELLNESLDYMQFIYFYQLALMLKKKLVFSTSTIGPIFSERYRRMAKEIFDASALIVPRDDESYDYLSLLGIKKEVFTSVTPDVGVLQDYISTEEAMKTLLKKEGIQIDSDAQIIGVSVSKWSDLSEGTNYIEEIKKFIRYLINQGYLILLMPTNYPFYEGMNAPQTDARLSTNIFQEIDDPRVFILRKSHTPEEYKGFLSLLTAFITTRMHASILSTMALIPTIVIGTQLKLRGYMRNIKQEDFVIDVNEVSISRLSEKFSKLMTNRESIVRSLSENREHVQTKASEVVDLLKVSVMNK